MPPVSREVGTGNAAPTWCTGCNQADSSICQQDPNVAQVSALLVDFALMVHPPLGKTGLRQHVFFRLASTWLAAATYPRLLDNYNLRLTAGTQHTSHRQFDIDIAMFRAVPMLPLMRCFQSRSRTPFHTLDSAQCLTSRGGRRARSSITKGFSFTVHRPCSV